MTKFEREDDARLQKGVIQQLYLDGRRLTRMQMRNNLWQTVDIHMSESTICRCLKLCSSSETTPLQEAKYRKVAMGVEEIGARLSSLMKAFS
jgi:hypothetical protein